MTERSEMLEVEIGEACEIDPSAGPIEQRDTSVAERDVLLYINVWCGDCRRAVRFLDEHEIGYRTIDIDQDAEAARTVESLNRGNRSTPTILVNGEHVATEPSRAQLAEIFGTVDTEPRGLLRRLSR